MSWSFWPDYTPKITEISFDKTYVMDHQYNIIKVVDGRLCFPEKIPECTIDFVKITNNETHHIHYPEDLTSSEKELLEKVD